MYKSIYRNDLVIILGPTATGKTKLAVKLAEYLGGEIISADSRQVYMGLDIGTGKDLKDYIVNNKIIPYHLIDIVKPKENYSVYEFQKDFNKTFFKIKKNNKLPILCGGTGYYIKAVMLNYNIPQIKPNHRLRENLNQLNLDELIKYLESISSNSIDNKTLDTKRRIIRAIEIEKYNQKYLNNSSKREKSPLPFNNPIVIGIELPRNVIRSQITIRLKLRLEQGMIEETEKLLISGVSHERLESFGLEYRFISRYLRGLLAKDEMFEKLNTAISQFAKKQMTFFRNMENHGIKIHWIKEGNFQQAINKINHD